jgi:ribosomal protein S18 acetylase RimI-like enzyme
MQRHLAQLNIATLRHPLDDPRIAEFVEALPAVNGAGEQSAGFVWRLQSDAGDATDIRVFDDPLMIVNLTVWTSVDDLKAFAFKGLHRDYFRRRAEWFVEGSTRTALWWLPVPQLPTTDDAKRRLEFIEAFGASPYAFRMGQNHPALVTHRVAPDDARVQRLRLQLSDQHDLDVGGPLAVVVGEIDDVAETFGSYRQLDEATAYIDRIHVSRSARGMRLGAAIVAELEAEAAAAGLRCLCLHTVPAQVAPYEKFGFRQQSCNHDTAGSPRSICLEKTLAPSPAV